MGCNREQGTRVGKGLESTRHNLYCERNFHRLCDTRDKQIWGKIPKYYFSTILSYKNGQYKAIGFYIEHKSDKSKNIKACAKSIDELESLTGLDFYHNLPDEIETAVEANYKESDWSW